MSDWSSDSAGERAYRWARAIDLAAIERKTTIELQVTKSEYDILTNQVFSELDSDGHPNREGVYLSFIPKHEYVLTKLSCTERTGQSCVYRAEFDPID